jgi:hypothetical protein
MPVARLTWQAADPAALAADLAERLGPGAEAEQERAPTSDEGRSVLDLGAARLEVVPWRPEAADDHPRAAGRLVFEPLESVLEVVLAASGPLPSTTTAPAFRLVGVAWATVDLERAADDLSMWLGPVRGVARRDPHLGARTAVHAAAGLPGDGIVLAEPDTEGRLAAVLARDGEGPAALYLRPAGGLAAWRTSAEARGVAVSSVAVGPLGSSAMLLLPVSGPQVILVDGHPGATAAADGGTIAP